MADGRAEGWDRFSIALVTSWPEVTAAAKAHASAAPKATEQAMLALDDEMGD